MQEPRREAPPVNAPIQTAYSAGIVANKQLLQAMKKPVNRLVAKKGKFRLAKRSRGGPCMRRPCTSYTRVRSLGGRLGAGRRDRTKEHTSLIQFYRPVAETDAFKKLVKDNMLIRRKNVLFAVAPFACGRIILFSTPWADPNHGHVSQRLMVLYGVPNHHIHGMVGIPHATQAKEDTAWYRRGLGRHRSWRSHARLASCKFLVKLNKNITGLHIRHTNIIGTVRISLACPCHRSKGWQNLMVSIPRIDAPWSTRDVSVGKAIWSSNYSKSSRSRPPPTPRLATNRQVANWYGIS